MRRGSTLDAKETVLGNMGPNKKPTVIMAIFIVYAAGD